MDKFDILKVIEALGKVIGDLHDAIDYWCERYKEKDAELTAKDAEIAELKAALLTTDITALLATDIRFEAYNEYETVIAKHKARIKELEEELNKATDTRASACSRTAEVLGDIHQANLKYRRLMSLWSRIILDCKKEYAYSECVSFLEMELKKHIAKEAKRKEKSV